MEKKLIGSGAEANIVWNPRDKYCTKVPKNFKDEKVVERLGLEYSVLVNLQRSKYVPEIYGKEEGELGFRMQYFRAKDLQKLIDEAKRGDWRGCDPKKFLPFFAEVCKAVDYIHSKGVVHQDIRPSNILWVGDRHPVIIDYTFVRAVPTDGMVFGTPSYFSPEKARSLEIDDKSDVYSLGIVAYLCLGGSLLFSRGSTKAIIRAHAEDEPIPLRNRRARIDPLLNAFVMGCLEKDPSKRPTAEQMADWVDDYCREEFGGKSNG